MTANDARSSAPAASPPPARDKRRRWSSWLLEAALVVVVYLGISAFQTRHLLDRNTYAPRFELFTLQGDRVSLSTLRGKRVLVHFWATWCGVCRQEFGMLNALHRSLSKDEALISIVTDADDPEALGRFVADNGIEYPVLLATKDVVHDYGVSAFPTNYFLDALGRVRGTTVGMSTRLTSSVRLWLAR